MMQLITHRRGAATKTQARHPVRAPRMRAVIVAASARRLPSAGRNAMGPRDADPRPLTRADYENLLAFRVSMRRFQHWSETQARAAGLTSAQHQLLLAVKGHPGAQGPTIGDLADYLLLRPHSTGELVDRAAAAGLVERWGDDGDKRVTRVRLTPAGVARLARLAPAHLSELRNLVPVLDQLMASLADPAAPGPATPRPATPGPAAPGPAAPGPAAPGPAAAGEATADPVR
jgi:DNA-binding MarR family transcriptional regulator